MLEDSQVAACVMVQKYLGFIPPISLQPRMQCIVVVRVVSGFKVKCAKCL